MSAELRNRAALIDALDELGLSDRAAARAAGLGHATINHLVTGRRTRVSPATAAAIEAALGFQPGGLFEVRVSP